MIPLRKLSTCVRLLARLEFSAIHRRLLINTGQLRASRHRGNPFINRDLGFPAVCHPDWADSLSQFSSKEGDHWEMTLLRKWLSPGDTAVDLGTNLGLYSFAIADRVGSMGYVLAVDADPFITDKLNIAAALLGAHQINTLQAAVSDCDGTATFYVRCDGAITAEQSLMPPEVEKKASTAITSPTLTIDSLFRKLPNAAKISLIKIDIEGAEGLAFRAVPGSLLQENGPFWLVEINPEALRRFGDSPDDILKRFSPEHFELWLLPKHPLPHIHHPLKLRRLEAREDFGDSLYYNLFAIPRGKRWRDRRLAIRKFLPLAS